MAFRSAATALARVATETRAIAALPDPPALETEFLRGIGFLRGARIAVQGHATKVKWETVREKLPAVAKEYTVFKLAVIHTGPFCCVRRTTL